MSSIATSNHFELFGLPVRFAIDPGALDAAYRSVQSQVHPDRFVHATDVEKRVAMQWASRANEAYRVLRAPLKRAAYLCELNGTHLETESNTAMPAAFLMQQMEWREQLDALKASRDMQGLIALSRELQAEGRILEAAVALAADTDGDYAAVAEQVRRWMFVDKFAAELESLRAQWH
jgi:molecular chaperone HscB